VSNNITEKEKFSIGKNAAIIRVVAPVQSGSQKMGKSPKIRGEKSRRSVWYCTPYSIVVKKWAKAVT